MAHTGSQAATPGRDGPGPAPFPEALPLAVYLHLPWCLRKCPYCDFNSHDAPDALPEGRYVAALLTDLELELPRVWGRRIESVFIGGGTPSLFAPERIDDLLQGLRARLPLRPDTEITLEANPGTFEQARFRAFHEAGVNRLSIGVQSFDDDALLRIGRVHDGGEARRAVEIARSAGFENLNIDLMYALPGQDAASAARDLATAIDLQPEHISYYQLTLEPNTLFHARPPVLPDEDSAWAMQETGRDRLAAAGFEQYEVSAYARSGAQCRHNLNYWSFGDYLGIGAGAHGKLSSAASGSVERHWKLRQPEAYMRGAEAGAPDSGRHDVAPDDLVFEFMLNALRLNAGFTPGLFEARCALPWSRVEGRIAAAETQGLLRRDAGAVHVTALGRQFLNDLTARFLPED